MTIVSIFQSALARRLAYVLVASALAWFGVGRAHAQTDPDSRCKNLGVADASCSTRGLAYEYAKASAQYVADNSGGERGYDGTILHSCPSSTLCIYEARYQQLPFGNWNGSTVRRYDPRNECPEGKTWDEATQTCKGECSVNDPPLAGGWVKGATLPYGVCIDGCSFSSEMLPGNFNQTYKTVDGETYWYLSGWRPTGESCSASDNSSDPPSDSDDDGVSDGNDNAPNNPGDSSSPNNPDKPKGNSNDDGDGSGNGNQSAGGGSCGAPPSSSGDAILAQIAYQTWATRCAIEGAKDGNGNLKTTQGNGSGSGSGTGAGNQQGNGECAQGGVNQAICLSKEYLKKVSDFFSGLNDEASSLDTDEGDLEDADSIWGDSPQEAELNSAGFGLGRSCPAPPTYMGESLDPSGNLCMFASIIGALVLVAAYAQAAYIIGRA